MLIDDKLTNKDAITVLRNLQDWLYLSGINGGTSIQREAIDIAIKALEAEPHWIPVTEEPIPDGEYLVTWTSEIQEKPIISIVCRYSEVWDCWELQALGHQDIKILAYMPLPEPYKGVTE